LITPEDEMWIVTHRDNSENLTLDTVAARINRRWHPHLAFWATDPALSPNVLPAHYTFPDCSWMTRKPEVKPAQPRELPSRRAFEPPMPGASSLQYAAHLDSGFFFS
jgi:hypothetical protein